MMPGRCVAVDIGAWTRGGPGRVWPARRSFLLTEEIERGMDHEGWRVAEPRTRWRSPRTPPPTGEFARLWAWLAPTRDSFRLRRPAALSEGIWIAGHWSGDTLSGRAWASNDVVNMQPPRANVYAVRYPCRDRTAASRADQTLSLLLAADVENPRLGELEDSVPRTPDSVHRRRQSRDPARLPPNRPMKLPAASGGRSLSAKR